MLALDLIRKLSLNGSDDDVKDFLEDDLDLGRTFVNCISLRLFALFFFPSVWLAVVAALEEEGGGALPSDNSEHV